MSFTIIPTVTFAPELLIELLESGNRVGRGADETG